MGVLQPHDVISVPVELGHCSACSSLLFASISAYFTDTGEPIETSIYVGCSECETEAGEDARALVRQWVVRNYRLAVDSTKAKRHDCD